MSEDQSHRFVRVLTAAGFSVIALLIATDLVLDEREGAGFVHILLEGLVLLSALLGAGLSLKRFDRVTRDLDAARNDVVRWRHEHQSLVKGLGSAIRQQFGEWGLSPSEEDIGMLLLKGLSHAEIAALRGTSERTVREQSRSLYRKAKLRGRNELAAFFLEDLLPPQEARLD